jgi:hypothetical protein
MSSSSWTLTGNAGTAPPNDFVGTSDNQPLTIKTNGAQRAVIDTAGNIGLTANLGIGTDAPRSIIEAEASIAGAMGPVITLTNGAVDTQGSAVAIDLNTFPPPPSGPIVSLPTHPVTTKYNPCARIEATSGGNYEADIVLLSNNPGGFNNGLTERMRISPGGTTVHGTLCTVPLSATIQVDGPANPSVTDISIGVGTATPLAPLHVVSQALDPEDLLPVAAPNTNVPVALIEANSSNNPSPRLGFVDTSKGSNATAPVWFVDNNQDNFRIFRQPNYTTAGTAYVQVDNTGQVGIGEPNPAAALHITGPSNAPPSGLPAPDNGLLLGSNGAASYKWIQSYGGPLVLNPAGNDVSIGPSGTPWLTISSSTGLVSVANDLVLTGADCAEHFDFMGPVQPEPGTVLVIDKEGSLRESRDSYDRKVAGVVSGAGEYRHGILLDGRHREEPRVALALTGKVFCKVDAQYSPIEVGDLLTTSPTPGHAMKATEGDRAFGAVIGKALRALEGGQGLLPILISLQ